ncbi:peptidoglycan DD-metalloendopeptidase family protein [Leptodesmis sichuanensis A121]|nr:peptidoglycan DD-metalloendopeptidase family protein [Leptodesmis sichuanensis A121]
MNPLTIQNSKSQIPNELALIAQVSVQDLQQQRQQLEQQRSQLSEQQKYLKNLEKAAQKNLKGLQKTAKVTGKQIQVSTAQLQTAIRQLQTLEGKLAIAEQSYRQKQGATIARLQFLQRQQLDRGWAVLLQSRSLNDFLDRRYRLKLLYQNDRQTLAGLQSDADQLEQQRDRVERKKNEIALMKQQLELQKASMEDQIAGQKENIDRLKSDRRAMAVAEAQLEQDSRTIALLIQQHTGAGGYGLAFRGTGQMLLPCLGEITSGFGWRMHPVLGYERFHAGIDIGADYGATIYAAEQGLVIFAGWYGGYGNAVIIDHGGGITTLYGHTSELYVSEGQTVQRGQAIAAVGSTGLSTGPHLHFEVRREGEPTDPVAFL